MPYTLRTGGALPSSPGKTIVLPTGGVFQSGETIILPAEGVVPHQGRYHTPPKHVAFVCRIQGYWAKYTHEDDGEDGEDGDEECATHE